MLGTDGVTAATVARMQTAVPGKLVELRTRLGRDKRALPDPTVILDYEPGQVDAARWPFWYVQTVDQTAAPRADELDRYNPVFAYRYTVRVAVWQRGTEHTAEKAMRTHLLAAQEILLAYPVLLDPDDTETLFPGQHARIDPDGIRVRPGAPEIGRGRDTICAGWIEARVTTLETLTIAPIDVDGARITGSLL